MYHEELMYYDRQLTEEYFKAHIQKQCKLNLCLLPSHETQAHCPQR